MRQYTAEEIRLAEELDSGYVTLDEIQRCVKDAEWQKFRASLKGLSTQEKLRKLRSYKASHSGRCVDVRVTNYINALRRGGLLPAGKK